MAQLLLQQIHSEMYHLRVAVRWLSELSRMEWLAIAVLLPSVTMFVRWSIANRKDDQRVHWRI